MTIKTITISLVTYNSSDIFKTLDNLVTEILPYFPANILLFDNNSDETFKDRLKKYETENVQLTFYHENKGFGFGHNHNAQQSDSNYFVICNPDILIDQQSFQKLYDYLEEHPEAALTAPKVLYPDGETQYLMRQKLDVFDYILRFIPFKFVKKLFRKRLAAFECHELTDQSKNQVVQFASGCFMFYRKADFDLVGGFDERFFMYFEDNDLCQKTRQAGKQIVYVPDAHVIHFYGRDSHKSTKGFTIFLRSMRTYFKKWGWQFF